MNTDFIKRVILLDKAELLLERNKNINGEQYNKLRIALNKCWIHIWDFEYSNEENQEFYKLFPDEEKQK